MKLETLRLKPDFVGQAYYEGQGTAPTVVNGQRGQFARHILNSERHGTFHVITTATTEVIPHDSLVEVVDPIFLEDYVNGRNVSPSLNIMAKGFNIIKGGQN